MTAAERTGDVRLLAVGDVFFDRVDPDAGFETDVDLEPLTELLATGDVVFGNCEGAYTAAADRSPHARGPQVAPPANASLVGRLGFDVMSLANNHVLDGGYAGLQQTQELLGKEDVRTVGAGSDLGAALAPVVVEHRGVSVAILAVSAVFPVGYEARVDIPGLAPLRAHTAYLNPDPGNWDPGAPPQTVTFIDDSDSGAVENAVRDARELADIVVVSIHWGTVREPRILTDYEPQAAQLLADAGADLVWGHHQHTLRGAGTAGDALIFYGLGHLACDLPHLARDLRRETQDIPFDDESACHGLLGEHGIYPRAGYPLLPFESSARRTAVARCDVGPAGSTVSGLYPCRIEPSGAVVPLRVDDPRCAEDLSEFEAALQHVPSPVQICPEPDAGLVFWRFVR